MLEKQWGLEENNVYLVQEGECIFLLLGGW